MIGRGGALCALAASACLWGGSTEPNPIEAVHDPAILQFTARIERFYEGLVGRPLDVRATYDDLHLRSFFADTESFSDYYAALATELRRAGFRHSRPTRVEILEFHFEGPGRAIVHVRLTGRHLRTLRFWNVDVERADTWERLGATWMVSPGRL